MFDKKINSLNHHKNKTYLIFHKIVLINRDDCCVTAVTGYGTKT